MIIISSGFPKSASTLLFLYQEHLLSVSRKSRGQVFFRKWNREGFVPHIGILRATWLVLLSILGPIVVKTHCGPTFFVRVLIRFRLAAAYYSIRDPRDVVLSAMDHAVKARNRSSKLNSDISFAQFHSWHDLYPALRMHYARFLAWKQFKTFIVRYEDVIRNPSQTLLQINNVTGQEHLNTLIPETIEWFMMNKSETINYNTGKLSRYKEELTTTQIAELEKELYAPIASMEYPLDKVQ